MTAQQSPEPPAEPQPASQTEPQTQPQPQPAVHHSRVAPVKSGPRTGSIVWGALVLVFCTYVASVQLGNTIDPATWIIATFIGLGVLLLAVGGAIVVRNARDRR